MKAQLALWLCRAVNECDLPMSCCRNGGIRVAVTINTRPASAVKQSPTVRLRSRNSSRDRNGWRSVIMWIRNMAKAIPWRIAHGWIEPPAAE